ncbi:MAG: hydrogenase iron-sulfur subunit [Myxococcales bacterium]|nr:hydrogenase iron-sulfur subunit [Myxococcales bacterium]
MSPPPGNPLAPGVDGAQEFRVLSGSQSSGAEAPEIHVEPVLLGDRALRVLEKGFLHLDRLVTTALPAAFNPFQQTGAIAITSLSVATVTGIVLLLWYKPSVHLAYTSVTAMSEAPWTAGLMRSLHRYSSDACMFFTLVHACRVLFERRVGGARWLAWVTGMALIGVLWFTGWTGYWLVWDERAQQVAVGSARLLDVLPIFIDPMGRSFLTDASVNSLLFFVVFFVHMLVPLAMALFLWLHIARLARARYLTRGAMTGWVLASLVLMSLVLPADSAEPARMAVLPQSFSMDWWYLMPLVLTDRLGGGALWAVLLTTGALGFSAPWWMVRGQPRPAQVVVSRCNACMKCFQDCPYEAISMVPRSDGTTRHALQAKIDPAKCVGCGICAGSCDTAGIGLDWFGMVEQRKRMDDWVAQAVDANSAPHVAFVCAESAAANLRIDRASGQCAELPGYRVLEIPCAGWVHPLLVERALRRGALGVVIQSCGPGECRYREGAEWTRLRLAGAREPALRADKIEPERVLLLELDRTRTRNLVAAANAFRARGSAPGMWRLPARLGGLAAAGLAALCIGVTWLISDLVYAAPGLQGSELVVTFKHPGVVSEDCRVRTPEELADLPAHMRRAEVCDRMRADVRLQVSVDGEPRVRASFRPKGIWHDGNSIAVERVPVAPGEHRVRVAIGDSVAPDAWQFVTEQTLRFEPGARRVLVFDRLSGFSWH